ncbi:ABC transporter substrate-binding protein [Gammaproteobacteria bacterium]|jgi:glycine betaine/proline transport system substrate-binding protein|nr:ABC transporter substrate-binding protein [Gammaproteobacteria bacterium]
MSSKLKAILAFAVLSMSISILPSAQADKRLTTVETDWTGGLVTERTIQYVLENEMGYTFKKVTMASGPGVWHAMKAGDLDYQSETWPSYNPIKSEFLEEYGGDGSLKIIADTGIIGASGYWVPRYVIEGDSSRGIEAVAPNLKTVQDLNQYKHVFKSLESGDRGNLIGCPVAAWQCEDQERLDALGVDFHAQALGSDTAHWAELMAKHKRGEPFVAYAWSPHWIFAALDLVEVELPEYDEAKWPATNWPKDITFKFGNPKFIEDHPDVVKVLENHRLTNNQQAVMIYEIDVNKRDVDEVVAEWMEANESVWRSWLP